MHGASKDYSIFHMSLSVRSSTKLDFVKRSLHQFEDQFSICCSTHSLIMYCMKCY